MRHFTKLLSWGLLWMASAAWAFPDAALPPLVSPDGRVGAGWRVVGFPKGHTDLPLTRFQPGQADGVSAMQVLTEASYGTLVHEGISVVPGRLQWRWRLDQPLAGGHRPPDLSSKAGDDAALKLCVMFDQPIERIPFWERTALRVARTVSSQALPAATLCYVWDSAGPTFVEASNPYTRRVRFVVLQGRDAPLSRWITETRNVADDFARLFADELPQGAATPADRLPRISSVVIGADSDNTASHSKGWFSDLSWQQ